jgi:predicted PurR-regulated permease PerM
MANQPHPVQSISDRRVQTVCLMVLATVAGLGAVYWLRPVLVPLVVAIFVVSGINPLLTYLEHRLHVSRIFAAGLAFLLGTVFLGAFLVAIASSARDLNNNKDRYQQRVKQITSNLEGWIPSRLTSSVSWLNPEFWESDKDKGKDKKKENESEPEPAKKAVAGEQESEATTDEDAEKESTPDEASEPQEAKDGTEDSEPGGKESAPADPESTEPVETEATPQVLATSAAGSELSGTLPSERKLGGKTAAERQQDVLDELVSQGIAIVSQGFMSLISTSIIVLIYVFFLLLGKPSYADTETVREIDLQIRTYLSLKTVISVVTGAVFSLALALFGVPMALSFGVMAFLLNFIPNIGPVIATILPLPLIILDPSGNLLWMVAAIATISAIQLISGNVIEPKMMGDSSDLHPVTILVGLMFWGMMWGIIGMFLATPIIAAAKIVLERFEPTRKVALLMAGRWEEDSEPAAT